MFETRKDLFNAIKRQDLPEVRRLIETSGFLRPKVSPFYNPHDREDTIMTPLYLAIQLDNKYMINYFKRIDKMEYETLRYAYRVGDKDMVDSLFEGKDINHKWSKSGATALHIAVMAICTDNDMIQDLITRGIDVHARMWNGERMVKASDLGALETQNWLREVEKAKPYSSMGKATDRSKTTSTPCMPTHNGKQLTPTELANELRSNNDLLNFFLYTGTLAKAFELFSHEQSEVVYKDLHSKMDKKTQKAVQDVIRNLATRTK